jgi:hypothetical protein
MDLITNHPHNNTVATNLWRVSTEESPWPAELERIGEQARGGEKNQKISFQFLLQWLSSAVGHKADRQI